MVKVSEIEVRRPRIIIQFATSADRRLSGLIPLAFSQRSCPGLYRLGRIKRFTLLIGSDRWSGLLGRSGRLLEVYFAILDCVDDGPAIGGHARVEPHVYVGFTDVPSEDVCGA